MLRAPALLLAALATTAVAATALAAPLPSQDRLIWESSGFLNFHPDVKHRKAALLLLDQGRLQLAAGEFRRAARYGDKPSQAMLGEMHWSGSGVPRDRALAYAWMDLAAERGYLMFLGKRERYWRELDDAQRRAALQVGAGLYAEYGDDVARRRLDQKLLRGRRQAVGSRTGFIGAIRVELPSEGGRVVVSGEDYYSPNYWHPERYARFTDAIWTPFPDAKVEVGPLNGERDPRGGEGGGGGS